jgi:hypothetical protein
VRTCLLLPRAIFFYHCRQLSPARRARRNSHRFRSDYETLVTRPTEPTRNACARLRTAVHDCASNRLGGMRHEFARLCTTVRVASRVVGIFHHGAGLRKFVHPCVPVRVTFEALGAREHYRARLCTSGFRLCTRDRATVRDSARLCALPFRPCASVCTLVRACAQVCTSRFRCLCATLATLRDNVRRVLGCVRAVHVCGRRGKACAKSAKYVEFQAVCASSRDCARLWASRVRPRVRLSALVTHPCARLRTTVHGGAPRVGHVARERLCTTVLFAFKSPRLCALAHE